MSWIKYKIQKKQQYSGGTWVDIVPLETKYGEELGVYNTFSGCSGYDLLTRWITEDINKEYICSGLTKYYKEVEQVSYDRGETWYSFIPEISRIGGVYEESSADCLPSAGHYRAKIVLPDNSEYILPCTAITSSSTLTIQDWNALSSLSGISYNDIHTAKELYIGDCITKIGIDSESGAGDSSYWPIYQFSNLKFISMADSVTDIGKSSINDNDSLTSIKLSNNLKNIWTSAFYGCTKLRFTSLPNSVENLYSGSLNQWALPKIKFPDSVKLIKSGMPGYVNTVIINSGVKEIGLGGLGGRTCSSPAFKVDMKERVAVFKGTTPPTISEGIGSNFVAAFVPSNSLSTYRSALIDNMDDIDYSGNTILPMSEYVENYEPMIFSKTFSGQTGSSYSTSCIRHFPEIKSGKVTKSYVGNTNFSKGLQRIWLSDKVTNIDNNAFGWPSSNLTKNTEYIAIEAVVPPTINKVYDTGLEGILINNLATFPIYVPAESVTDYKNSAGFYRYANRIYAMPAEKPSDVAFIGYYNDYEIKKIYRFDLNDTILTNYYLCPATSIITSCYVGDLITRIENNCFYGCLNLKECTIGSGVTSIGNNAFYSSTLLKSIIIKATTPPTIGTNAFPNNNCPILVPSGSVNDYKSSWPTYADRIQSDSPIRNRTIVASTLCVGYDLHSVNEYQVSRDYGKTWTTLSSSTGNLIERNSASCGYPGTTFNGKFKANYAGTPYSAACDGSTTITSGETRPSGYNYSGITSVEIGNCVTKLGVSAFYNIDTLTSVTISSGVTTIEKRSLSEGAFTTISLPNTVTTIDESAFSFNFNLTSIVLPESVTYIGNYAFYNCTSLTSITCLASIPPTLGGTYTFHGNNNLTIYVKSAYIEAYLDAWSQYSSRIQAIPT